MMCGLRRGGSTALVDAIGRTIDKIDNAQKHSAEDYRAEKVMFVIITDGYENASRKYTSSQVKELIEHHKTALKWEFIFLGANMDAVETARHYGISADRAVDYVPDAVGTRLNYHSMSSAVSSFRTCGTVDESAMENIRSDMRARGGRR